MIWFALVIAAVWVGVILGLIGMVIYAVRTGRLPNKFTMVIRHEGPTTFWSLVSAWIAVIAAMTYLPFMWHHLRASA